MSDGPLLVIDPGLDAMGCAIYRLHECDPRAPELALQWVETVRTLSSDPLKKRFARLAQCAKSLVEEYSCTRALIELPSFSGTYSRNRGAVGRDGMAANMAKLNLAIGYIAGSLAQRLAVEFVSPLTTRKDLKLDIARLIVAAAEKRRKVTLSGRVPSADALDAVALGASQLQRFTARELTPRLTRAT